MISADLLKGSRELESFLPSAFSSLLLRRWGKPLVNIIYIHGTFLTILWNKNYMYCRLKKLHSLVILHVILMFVKSCIYLNKGYMYVLKEWVCSVISDRLANWNQKTKKSLAQLASNQPFNDTTKTRNWSSGNHSTRTISGPLTISSSQSFTSNIFPFLLDVIHVFIRTYY